MIEYITDTDGKITCCISWYRLTKHNQYDPRFTKEELCIAHIDTFWRHRDCDKSVRECIRVFTDRIKEKYPEIYCAGFNRHRTDGRRNSPYYYYKQERLKGVPYGEHTKSISSS